MHSQGGPGQDLVWGTISAQNSLTLVVCGGTYNTLMLARAGTFCAEHSIAHKVFQQASVHSSKVGSVGKYIGGQVWGLRNLEVMGSVEI